MSTNCQQLFIQSDLRINFKLQQYRANLQQLILNEKQHLARIDAHAQQLGLYHARLALEVSEKEALKRQVVELQLLVQEIKSMNLKVSSSNEKLKLESAERENQMQQVHKVKQDAQRSLRELQAQISQLRSRLKQVQIASSSAQQQASQLKQRIVTLQSQNRALREEASRAKRELQKQEQARLSECRDRQKSDNQIKLLKESQKKLQSHVNKLQNQKNSLSREKSQTASVAKSHGEALQKKLARSLEDNQSLRRELADLRGELSSCEKERQQLQQLMMRCKERHQSELKLLKRKIQLQRIKDLQLTAYDRVVEEFESILKLSVS